MTDEQAQEIIDDLVKHFGDALPNPEHNPKSFDYYLTLYKYFDFNKS